LKIQINGRQYKKRKEKEVLTRKIEKYIHNSYFEIGQEMTSVHTGEY
jgi:hypothetical protein